MLPYITSHLSLIVSLLLYAIFQLGEFTILPEHFLHLQAKAKGHLGNKKKSVQEVQTATFQHSRGKGCGAY